MPKLIFGFAVLMAIAGLTHSTPSQAAGGPPCQECLDELDVCTRAATTNAEEAQCFVEFRACRVAC